MYRRLPTLAEMSAAGLAPEDYETDAVEIWPEHWQAVELFTRFDNKWAHGMAGPVGLRWESILPLVDRMGLQPEAWDEMVQQLEGLERGALRAMREKD